MDGVIITHFRTVGMPEILTAREHVYFQGDKGDLVRICDNASIQYLAWLSFGKDGRVRGNHVHHKKTESLYITKGRILAKFKNIATAEEVEQEIGPRTLITIAPGIAHAFKPVTDAEAIEFNDRAFDPSDKVECRLL